MNTGKKFFYCQYDLQKRKYKMSKVPAKKCNHLDT